MRRQGNKKPWLGLVARESSLALERSKMHLDTREYTTPRFDLSRHISELEGDWKAYLEVAERFRGKVKAQDREDIRQAIILELAQAKARDGDKPFPEARMYRIASFVVADYWRRELRIGRVASLDNAIGDGEGVELIDTLADDKAIDLEAWTDAKTWLLGCPVRLIEIAHKRAKGKALDNGDRSYLKRFRRNSQLSLF